MHGPVEAGFDAYEDLLMYSDGVYKHVTGNHVGGHAVKILGWGIEDNIPYWICANSWNKYWGNGGYFKIRRGHNECGIENNVLAGLPKI